MFSREKMTYQPSTSTLNCPVLEGSFLICTTSCKSNEYGAKKLRFASFPTNRWNIEKLRYDFIWINILYKNKIAFHKVSYKLPANTDLFISEQCLSKWQLFLVINNTGKCKSQQNLIFPGKVFAQSVKLKEEGRTPCVILNTSLLSNTIQVENSRNKIIILS